MINDTRFLIAVFGVLMLVFFLNRSKSKSKSNQLVVAKIVVKNFYAPWCGYSKRLFPTWSQLEKVYARDPKVDIQKVDCDANKKAAIENNIEGFPTIICFKSNGEKVTYNGNRSLEDLKSFIEQNK